jgi:hypothetical protein
MGKVLVKGLETEVRTSAGRTKPVTGDFLLANPMFEVDFDDQVYAKLAASPHKAPNLPYDGDDDL